MADKYFVTHNEMVGLANTIRAKIGKPDSYGMTLNQMCDEITGLSTKPLLNPADYLDCVRPEVFEIANKVNSVKEDNSIIFIAMSDSHYPASQPNTMYSEPNKQSSMQANQAAKALAYILDIDFFAHLGDIGTGAGTTTPDMLKEQTEEFLSYFREANSDIPVFLAIGNHDPGIYYHDTMMDAAEDEGRVDNNIYTLPGSYLFENFTKCSGGVCAGEEYGGYCYRDFEDKKLRVFLLNTSEKIVALQSDQSTFGSQRVWFANALMDLNSKSDADKWCFIVLSHYPADYGGNMELSRLLKAYVEGSNSFKIKDPVDSYHVGDGTSTTVGFAGKNSAKFIAQFHGHIHNFKSSQLHTYNTDVYPATYDGIYDAVRLCVSNVQYNRENEYSTVGSYKEINFGDDITYRKGSEDSAEGTSFVVNVINPSEQMIYSFCYGAGPDREIGYNFDRAKYTISSELTNIEVVGVLPSFIYEGGTFAATLQAVGGYSLEYGTVTVTMGGKVVENAYKDGVITIDNVDGDIHIIAKTEVAEYYTVTRTLENVTTNRAGTTKIYPPYTNGHQETLSFTDVGYTFEDTPGKSPEFKVLMNGIDISGSCVTLDDSGYNINIPEVTGAIEIIAKAVPKARFTNLVPTAIDTDGTPFNVDGLGYDNGKYLGNRTTGAGNDAVISTNSTTTLTGYIPITIPSSTYKMAIRIGGPNILTKENNLCRVDFYDSNFKTILSYCTPITNVYNDPASYGSVAYEEISADTGFTAWTLPTSANWMSKLYNASKPVYMRVSAVGDGANLIVTINEEIKYGGADPEVETKTHTVTQTLTNVVSSNNSATVNNGDSFATTLTPASGYELESVTVTMGGIDVTSSAVSNNQINIESVTGNIIITATATSSSASYTNLLPISTDVDGSFYNVKGYKEDTYITGGNIGTKTGYYTTGFIPVKYGDTLYFKNCTIQKDQSNHRFAGYDGNKVYIAGRLHNTTDDQISNIGTPVWDSDYNLVSLTISGIYWSDVKHIRFCCSYLGADSIVTVNEPIN